MKSTFETGFTPPEGQIIKPDAAEISGNKLKELKDSLLSIGVEYDDRLSILENKFRWHILESLRTAGALEYTGGVLILDKAKAIEILTSSEVKRFKVASSYEYLTRDRIIQVLDGVEVRVKGDSMQNKDEPPRPIVRLPQNSESFRYSSDVLPQKAPVISLIELNSQQLKFSEKPIRLHDGSEITLGELMCRARLIDLGLAYDPNKALEANILKAELFDKLESVDVLTKFNKLVVIDTQELQLSDRRTVTWNFRGPHNTQKAITMADVVDLLRDLSGFSQDQFRSEAFANHEIGPRPIVDIPQNLRDMLTPEAWALRAKSSVLKPWAISDRVNWSEEILLQDGTQVNLAELAITYELYNTLKAYRDPKTQELMIIDPSTGQKQKFNPTLFKDLTGISPSGSTDKDRRITFSNYGMEFAQKFLRNLLAAKILRPEDFKVSSQGEYANKYGGKRTFLKRGVSHYQFSNSTHRSVGYYFGRDTFLGHSDVRIDHDNTFVQEIDSDTLGIFHNTKSPDGNTKAELIFTCKYLDPETILALKAKKAKEIGRNATKSEITANLKVSAELIKPGFKAYQVEDYFARRSDESPRAYEERLTYLREADKVLSDFIRFCSDANLLVSDFVWEEKLIILNILRSGVRYDELVKFAQEYNETGVRALLLSEYDPSIAKDLIELAKVAEHKEDLTDIFDASAYLHLQSKRLKKVVEKTLIQSDLHNWDLTMKEDFAEELAEASRRHLKDILLAAIEIGKSGYAETEFYNGKQMSASNLAEVTDTVFAYGDVLDKLHSLLSQDGAYKFNLIEQEEGSPKSYSFAVHNGDEISYLTIQLRAVGVKRGKHNKLREYDGEARINILSSFVPIPLSVKEQARQDAISIRLDREGMTRWGKTLLENDPTRVDGALSLDVGFIDFDEPSSTLNDYLGRITAIGNALSIKRAKAFRKTPQYYHGRGSFSKAFGNTYIMQELVNAIDHTIGTAYPKKKLKALAQTAR